MNIHSTVKLDDFEQGQYSTTILKEVLAGLSKNQKSLPAKLLYDKRGSEIFEKICLLKEYYPTRAETEILKNYASEIARIVGPNAFIIEPGSGSGDKIRFLLPHLVHLETYMPIEISKEILSRMSNELSEEFPKLKLRPVCADFNLDFERLDLLGSERSKKVVFFPGSTIGNFTPMEAAGFLKKISRFIDKEGGLLIGVDLKKDPQILINAYDDPHGVTADFNLNLLDRLNRDAFASFDSNNFEHRAVYNEKAGRIEMHLVSKMDQLVKVNETMFRFKKGESIHTENSYKYTTDEFIALCDKAKLTIKKIWKDSLDQFCVYYFVKDNK